MRYATTRLNRTLDAIGNTWDRIPAPAQSALIAVLAVLVAFIVARLL